MTAQLRQLSRKHGIRVSPPFPCSVEQVALAVGGGVGYSSIRAAARMNGAVVLFLDTVDKVNTVVEAGITVLDSLVPVQPLAQPAVRVILSNVPPFAPNDLLTKELSRFGKVVSPFRDMSSGIKSPLLKHTVCFRRQVFMILNNRNEELNLRFRIRVDDYDYVFASSAGMKCFGCGEERHTVKSCPPPSREMRWRELGPSGRSSGLLCPTRRAQSTGCLKADSPHWLLNEPLIHGARLDISGTTTPGLTGLLIQSGTLTVGQLGGWH